MRGNARSFLKPKLVESQKIANNKYRIILEPLEKGFGHTLGNALRRTLLSSISGSAITEVAIDGVMHEFSTIDGEVGGQAVLGRQSFCTILKKFQLR